MATIPESGGYLLERHLYISMYVCMYNMYLTICVYRAQAKMMLSAANDGDIVAWSSGGGVFDVVPVSLCFKFQYLKCVKE